MMHTVTRLQAKMLPYSTILLSGASTCAPLRQAPVISRGKYSEMSHGEAVPVHLLGISILHRLATVVVLFVPLFRYELH